MANEELLALIEQQRAGWSLEQAFYLDPNIFALEQALLFPWQWAAVAHASELPRKGSDVVRPLFDRNRECGRRRLPCLSQCLHASRFPAVQGGWTRANAGVPLSCLVVPPDR